MKKLTDNFGNDLLDENGCVQYVKDELKTYTVTFRDTFKARGEDGVFDVFLSYLNECVENGDVTAFNFKEGCVKNSLHEALIKIAEHDIELLSYKGQELFNNLAKKGE